MTSKRSAAVFLFAVTVLAVVLMVILLRQPQIPPEPPPGRNFALIGPGEGIEAIVARAAGVVPSSRQRAWQERETIAFAHFGMNTFTGREWGEGKEDPALFNPTAFDARQWVRVVKDAGMKTLIVTAKHHDGFCLWPSAFTAHSVKSSPWRGGAGDVVGEVAAACRESGIGLGVYLSPWDRHEPSFGDSPRYNEHFLHQLRELLTNYGPVQEVWFDGANGEGPNGKRQVYDWPAYYKLIRELQPGAVIAIMGPDVRWVGTESGYGRETEWSVVPVDIADPAAVAASSQQDPTDGAFLPKDLMGEDLGSRDKLAAAKALIWYPAETDVSIRPGWFYHADQDGAVKSPEKLLDIYESSVGRNGVLLLNIPPDRRGLIHENDERSLLEWKAILDKTYRTNAAAGARIRASATARGRRTGDLLDGSLETYWAPPEGNRTAEIEFDLPADATFDRAVLQEYVRAGQRVEAFVLEAWNGAGWAPFGRGTTIGHKRILRFPPVTAGRVRFVIEQSRSHPAIASFGLFRSAVKGEDR